ncbi:MAG: DUF1835 domain-containing protein [Candidatus Thiodiazotropha sp.]
MIQSLPGLRSSALDRSQHLPGFPADDPRVLHTLSLQQCLAMATDLYEALRQGGDWIRATRYSGNRVLHPQSVTFADAQWIIAREQGLNNWAELEQHIVATDRAERMLEKEPPAALDAQAPVLHIRCGTDIRDALAIAGFQGDFLCFADPFIQGPVPAIKDVDELIRLRSDFIAGNGWRTAEQAHAELTAQYLALNELNRYATIACWFEQDAYDVLVFLKLLDHCCRTGLSAERIRYLCIGHYPGVQRFNGLGQLSASAMRVLWEHFQPITQAEMRFAQQCWEAYTAASPQHMVTILQKENLPFPPIRPGLQRHIQELPGVHDGLSLSERLTLRILREQGPQPAPRLFYHWYTTIYEPLVFMGDSSYWLLLKDLAEAATPAITLNMGSDKPRDWQVDLTAYGESLLLGDACWLDDNHYDRWWGGVHNRSGAAIWCWNEADQTAVQR